MAQLQYVLLGEFARVSPDGLTTIVGAGFDRIAVPTLPTQHLIGLALRILVDPEEKSASAVVSLRSPSGFQVRFQSMLATSPEARPHQGKVGIPLAVNLTALLDVEGTYRLEVQVNGEEVVELMFEVEVQPPTERAAG